MTDPAPQIDHAAIAAAMLQLAEVGAQVLEAVNGYRAQAQEAGYASAVVDVMCVEYHGVVLRLLLGPKP